MVDLKALARVGALIGPASMPSWTRLIEGHGESQVAAVVSALCQETRQPVSASFAECALACPASAPPSNSSLNYRPARRLPPVAPAPVTAPIEPAAARADGPWLSSDEIRHRALYRIQQQHLTYDLAAARIGISVNTLSTLLADRGRPSAGCLRKVLAWLSTPITADRPLIASNRLNPAAITH